MVDDATDRLVFSDVQSQVSGSIAQTNNGENLVGNIDDRLALVNATSFRLVFPCFDLIIVGTCGGVLCSLGLPKSIVVVVIVIIPRCNIAWIRDDMGWQLIVVP